MDIKLELVFVPVSDVDRSKAFHVDVLGFNADHDQQVNDELRFVQLTPPGSACSIAIGTGITQIGSRAERFGFPPYPRGRDVHPRSARPALALVLL